MLQSRFIHDLYGFVATAPGVRVWAENHGVPRLNRHDAFEEHGGSGIRNRGKRQDDADWFRDFDQAAFGKLPDGTDRTFIFYVVVDELGSHHVLEGFVFQHPKFCFFNRQASEMLGLLQSGHDHRLDDPVDVLLRVLGENSSGVSGLTEQAIQIGGPLATQALGGRRDPSRLLHCIAGAHVRPLLVWGGTVRRSGSVSSWTLSSLDVEQGGSSIFFSFDCLAWNVYA